MTTTPRHVPEATAMKHLLGALLTGTAAIAVTAFVEEIRIAVKADSSNQSFSQLNGRKVATTTGTTSVQLLRKHQKAAGVEFREIFGKDHTDSMLNLTSSRADAFVMDGQVLAGNIAKSRNAADFEIVGEVLGVEPIAIMIRKDDSAFKQSIDNSLRALIQNGKWRSSTTSGS